MDRQYIEAHHGEGTFPGLLKWLRSVEAESAGKLELLRADGLPCWRFYLGRAEHFGPASVVAGGEVVEDRRSIERPADHLGCDWGPGELNAAWAGWSGQGQQVYVEARTAALGIVATVAGREGQHVEETMARDEVRLHCARFAVWQVQRFQAWLGGIEDAAVDGVRWFEGVEGGELEGLCFGVMNPETPPGLRTAAAKPGVPVLTLGEVEMLRSLKGDREGLRRVLEVLSVFAEDGASIEGVERPAVADVVAGQTGEGDRGKFLHRFPVKA